MTLSNSNTTTSLLNQNQASLKLSRLVFRVFVNEEFGLTLVQMTNEDLFSIQAVVGPGEHVQAPTFY